MFHHYEIQTKPAFRRLFHAGIHPTSRKLFKIVEAIVIAMLKKKFYKDMCNQAFMFKYCNSILYFLNFTFAKNLLQLTLTI